MCAVKNHIFLSSQHSVSYVLASQISSVIYLINYKKLSYCRDRAGRQSLTTPFRSFMVIDFGTNRKPVCDLLLLHNTNILSDTVFELPLSNVKLSPLTGGAYSECIHSW